MRIHIYIYTYQVNPSPYLHPSQVTYTSTHFLRKNKDTLFAELPSTMRASSSRFVAGLFSDAAETRR